MVAKKVIPILQEFSLPLIGGVVLALIWANLSPDTYSTYMHKSLFNEWYPLGTDHPISFHFLMNDIFMVLFFGIAAKEIAESTLPGGALNPLRKAINPLFGTIGGVLGPIIIYFAYIGITGNFEISRGWGIPTATDIALTWLLAKVIFGPTHPAVSFLLLLAVADDGIGLGIIAVFYGDPSKPSKTTFLMPRICCNGLGLCLQEERYSKFLAVSIRSRYFKLAWIDVCAFTSRIGVSFCRAFYAIINE